jgi:uncharacterized membrane protein
MMGSQQRQREKPNQLNAVAKPTKGNQLMRTRNTISPMLGGLLCLFLSAAACFGQDAPHSTFTTFDVPGALSTFPYGINPRGEVTGYYVDANFVTRGFVRAPDGTFTTFDGPGSVIQTTPYGINPAGEITGWYLTVNFEAHGFLRAPDGTFTTFDAPGGVGITFAYVINPAGEIAGNYADANFVFHGFLRARNGTFTTFDIPGGFAPNPTGINPAAAITGYFFLPTPVPYGSFRSFVRDPKGAVTIFDAPNACQTSNSTIGTNATGISPRGTIVGSYIDATCMHQQGFLRSPDGTFTTISVPGATDTFAAVINPAGVIAGAYRTSSGDFGFYRSPSGRFIAFSGPGGAVPSVTAINPAGTITGYYVDANFVAHGYLWSPHGGGKPSLQMGVDNQ